MSASRSCTTALALAFVAGCVRPQAPVASAASTAATASTSTSASTPKGAAEGSSVASVRPGNQRPLNGAAVAFASYLNRMHNRIHPEFTDKVLAKLDTLPPNHPMNDNKLITRLEVVIDGETGLMTSVLLIRGSGIAEFDTLAVESLKRALPFDDAPPEIRSTDGNVYVHWEFWRDEVFACSTMHARPFLLTTPSQKPSAPSLAL